MPNEFNIINIPNVGGYKIALDKESNSLYAAQITSSNYLSGITSSDFFRISQQIFSVPSFDSVQPSGTGIYIDDNGQSKFYDGTDFVDISYEIVSQISVDTIKNDDTVPTTRAVSAFVEKSVPSSIQLSGTIVGTAVFNGSDVSINTSLGSGFSIDASKVQGLTISWNDVQNKPTIPSIDGLATETYVDSKVSSKLDKSEFNTFKTDNTNAITSAKTEAITYTDSVLSSKVNKADIVQNFTELDENKIPSIKAVAEFVNSKEVTPEVYYISSFDTVSNESPSGLYIDYEGETKFYSGDGNWQQISKEIITEITAAAANTTVPTTKAVYDFVKMSLTSSIKAIGIVSTSGALPTNAEINDLYFVGPSAGKYAEYVLTVNGWEQLGIINDIDLSNYATLDQLSTKLDKSEFNTFKTNNTTAINNAITSANTYTNQQVSGKVDKSELNGLASETYVDSKVSSKLDISVFNTFKTENTNAIISAANEAKTEALTEAKEYTNNEILKVQSGSANIEELLSSKADISYVNEQIENAITSANTYTDTQVSSKISKADIAQDFTSLAENKIPSVKAVADFIDNKEVLPEVYYVQSFNEVDMNISGLYIDDNGETRYCDGVGNWQPLSYEAVDKIDSSSTTNTIPTTKAVYDFVKTEINNTDIPVASTPEVFYVESFPANPSVSGLYITFDGETRFYDESGNYEQVSKEIVTIIDEYSTSGTVPTAKAVYDFVTANINTGTGTDSKSEVEISSSFPSTGKTDTIYVNSNSNEAKYYDSGWKNLSIKAIRNMSGTESDDVVPTTKAVYNFVQPKLNQKASINVSTTLPTTGDDNVFYVSESGQVAVKINDEVKNISVDVVDDIADEGTDMNIPTCEAVKEFVNGNTVTSTNQVIDQTITSYTHYIFSNPITSLSLDIPDDIKNTTIEFTASTSFTYAFAISQDKYKINKQFTFEDGKSYLILIDSGLILWTSVEEYVQG